MVLQKGGVIMATITVKCTDQEKEFFQTMAKFNGLSLSESFKKTMLEHYENINDVNAYDKAFKEYLDSGSKSRPFVELVKELGHDDILA